MSLVVSLRIPDGLVIAGDSLSTMQSQLEVAGSARTHCPSCATEFEIKDLKLPPIPVASSTRSFAQKIVSFMDIYGIGTTGLGALNNRTIYHHIKSIEQRAFQLKGVTAVAEYIHNYFQDEIKKQFSNIGEAPDDVFPLGFQVVGYDGDEGKTIKVDIGKTGRRTEYGGIGCAVSGEIRLVQQIWAFSKSDPRQQAAYGNFSLQDAIDYADFLIRTTATYQRFANIIPSVGGEIDIALITPYKRFTWIRSKDLTKILEDSALAAGKEV